MSRGFLKALALLVVLALPLSQALAQRGAPKPWEKKQKQQQTQKPAAKKSEAKKPAPAKPAAKKPAASTAAAPAAAATAAAANNEESVADSSDSDAPSRGGVVAIPEDDPVLSPAEFQAQIRECQARKPQRKAKGALTEGAFRQIERAQLLYADNKTAEAEAKLREFIGRSKGGYEKAVALQTLGFIIAGDSKKISAAIKLFKEALALDALPQSAHEQMVFNIAQLYLVSDQDGESRKWLNEYLDQTCNPLPDAHVMLASLHAEKKEYRKALEQVNLAIAKAKTPREPWLQLKLAIHYEFKEFPRCAQTLLQLVSVAPQKADYWKQLSSMLFELRHDANALAVLALADRKGHLTKDSEFRNLANLYFYMQVPYKAGQVVQRGLDEKIMEPDEKTLELLANAWLMARENDKAEAVLKKAATVSSKGEIFQRLGYLYVEKEDWKSALDALTKAQQKGVDKKQEGQLSLLVGIASVETGDLERAEKAFRGALDDEDTRKSATEWLNQLGGIRAAKQAEMDAKLAAAEAEAEKAAEAEAEKSRLN